MRWDVLEFLKKNTFSIYQNFISLSLTWDPMRATISKRYSSLKSLLSAYILFRIFFLVALTKVLF